MKFISLLSSGIDSPVATYLLSKKADELIFLYADNRPFTDNQEIENFKKLSNHLKKQIKSKIKVYLVPHGESLACYQKNCNARYACIFCKRMMLRYAEKIAEKESADAIIMGDSLGQVASQTLQNIRTIENVTDLPILRPLIGLDKEDVIKIAKEIGTYDLSIQKSEGCTAVPNKPATMAKINQILDEENKINVDELVNNAVKNAEIIKI